MSSHEKYTKHATTNVVYVCICRFAMLDVVNEPQKESRLQMLAVETCGFSWQNVRTEQEQHSCLVFYFNPNMWDKKAEYLTQC